MKTHFFNFQKMLLLALFALVTFSCSDDGKDGQDGAPGTANVIYSEWMPFPTTYSQVNYNSNPAFSFSFPAPELTQDVLNRGNVMTYIKTVDNEVFTAPYTFGTNAIIAPLLKLKDLRILTYQIGGPGFQVSSAARIRYVITPGGTAATAPAAKLANADYKNMPYEQVCTLLNIPM